MSHPYNDGSEPENPLSPEERSLQALLQEAAAHVEPADRLGELRRRTMSGRRSAPRRWLPIVGMAGAATAVVVGASVVIGNLGLPQEAPAAQRPQTGVAAPTVPVPVYYLADTNDGTRLFREFTKVPSSPDDAVSSALSRLTADVGPDDPDYRTAWPKGAFAGAEVVSDRIRIDLTAAGITKPAGVSSANAELGIQQAVYTAEAALGASLPVEFQYDGAPATTVLGEKVPSPVERDRRYAVTAPINISDPAEGISASKVLNARGIAAASVTAIRWRLVSLDDGDAALRGRTSAIGPPDSTDSTAIPTWETGAIDISSLPAGTYEFIVSGIRKAKDAPAIRFRDDRTVVIG